MRTMYAAQQRKVTYVGSSSANLHAFRGKQMGDQLLSVLMEMKLEEDEDESRSCCADEEELDRKEMTKRGLNNGIFDDSLDDFSVRKPNMCTEVVPPVQFRISKHADRGANAILIVVMVRYHRLHSLCEMRV
ncbi:hypothetical protein Tco_0379674 [Tanacetum coccineum]